MVKKVDAAILCSLPLLLRRLVRQIHFTVENKITELLRYMAVIARRNLLLS